MLTCRVRLLPGGYSEQTDSARVNPSFLQMALDGRFSTEGNAKADFRFGSLAIESMTSLVAAVATPRR